MLDVGCGTGSFLKVCQENGWEVYGIDPSDSAKRVGKEHYGLDIIQNYFEYFETEKKFDCITFWGSLEHLPQPMESLKKAAGLLNRDGIIIFEVPSSESILMRYAYKNNFVPYRCIENGRHVLYFSRRSIEFISRKFNLEIAYMETNGFDLQSILLYDFDDDVIAKIMDIQQIIDELMLGDLLKVFLKKNE
jgi:SAM-dependent methyltransferase